MSLVSLESLLIHLLDNAQISIFSKVDIMYLLLYWVTYGVLQSVNKKEHLREWTLTLLSCEMDQNAIWSFPYISSVSLNKLWLFQSNDISKNVIQECFSIML